MDDEKGIVLVKRKVDGVHAPVRLNKHEYDANPDAHELWDEKKHGGGKKPEPVTKPDGDMGEKVGPFTVGKNGKRGAASKFVVFNVLNERFDDSEYATEAEAWASTLDTNKG